MRMDAPQCNLKGCRHQADGNCLNQSAYNACEYTFVRSENCQLTTEMEQLKARLKSNDVKLDFQNYCELRDQNETLLSENLKLKSKLKNQKARLLFKNGDSQV